MDIDWDRVRVFDKEVAQMFVNMIKSSDSARSVGPLLHHFVNIISVGSLEQCKYVCLYLKEIFLFAIPIRYGLMIP